MKALSIIGIVFSLVLVLISLAIIDINCYSEWGTEHPGVEPGVVNLILTLFFLAFSIVACVVAFKKKNI